MNSYILLKPLLFRLPPEWAHRLALRFGSWASPLIPNQTQLHEGLQVQVGGLRFGNPLGLAAGWDKSCEAPRLLSRLPWGHFELGSVSALPSKGNPKPRLKRLPQDTGLIVNYGLPNAGAREVAKRLRKYRDSQAPTPEPCPRVGVNMVKTNDRYGPKSSLGVLDDFIASLKEFSGLPDYITLNLSCPNTDNDEQFFESPQNLADLLQEATKLVTCPLFLKIAPTRDEAQLEAMLAVVEPFECVKGFQFNLATGQPEWLQLKTSRNQTRDVPGAVAGRPTREYQLACLQILYRLLPPDRYSLISAGGIDSAETAYERICGGASLIQIYTALIYQGPGLIRQILDGLLEKLRLAGFNSIEEAVGTDLK